MGINDRDYMRHRDPEPVVTPLSTRTQAVMLGLCIVIGAIGIGSALQRDVPERQTEIEEIDMKKLEEMLRPPSDPPASIKRQVDINTATAEELDTLPYVGSTTAASIMSHRPYRTIDDLGRVPGLTEWKIDEIRPFAMASGPE